MWMRRKLDTTRDLIKALFDTMNVHEEVMLALISQQPWDLFIGVITANYRLHHFLFDVCCSPSHPRHRDCIDYYRRIDDFFGRLRGTIGARTKLMVLSDHGFTNLKLRATRIMFSRFWVTCDSHGLNLNQSMHASRFSRICPGPD